MQQANGLCSRPTNQAIEATHVNDALANALLSPLASFCLSPILCLACSFVSLQDVRSVWSEGAIGARASEEYPITKHEHPCSQDRPGRVDCLAFMH